MKSVKTEDQIIASVSINKASTVCHIESVTTVRREGSGPGQGEKMKYSTRLANVGIEPKTFALLARRSNQLS